MADYNRHAPGRSAPGSEAWLNNRFANKTDEQKKAMRENLARAKERERLEARALQDAAAYAFDAMLESVANPGQRAVLEGLRDEYIARYRDGFKESYTEYMNYWRARLG